MKYFENKRIRRTTNRIDALKKECISRRVFGARMSLDRVASTLNTRNNRYTRRKDRLVNDCLNKIARNLSEEYVGLIKNECLKASSIILDNYVEPSQSEQLINDDNEKIDQLECRLRFTQNRLNEINTKMDEALGKDELTWKKLNKERHLLLGKLMAENQVFDSMLTHSNNLRNAEWIRELRESYSNAILEQQSLVDVEEFRDNVETNKYTHEESERQGSEMESILYENCAEENDEYKKALEAKMLKTDMGTIPADMAASTKTSDGVKEGSQSSSN